MLEGENCMAGMTFEKEIENKGLTFSTWMQNASVSPSTSLQFLAVICASSRNVATPCVLRWGRFFSCPETNQSSGTVMWANLGGRGGTTRPAYPRTKGSEDVAQADDRRGPSDNHLESPPLSRTILSRSRM